MTLSATAPAISGMTVTLTLATALAAGDTEVKVSYAQPSSGSNNKLADGDGNLVASFTDQAVTNNTPSTDPFLSALTVSPRNIIGFRSDRISYEVGVASTVTTATITPTTNHSAATVAYSKTDEDSGADELQFTLSAGRNEVTVTVTAEDGVSTLPYTVSVNQGVTDAYGWKAGDDFDGVREGTPQTPGGIWSNGTTMWVTDWSDREIDAYLVSDGSRDSANDFNSLIGNSSRARATSIWSDGETMWVAFDGTQSSIFAYRMSNMTRNTSKDFNTLAAEGNQKPWGIWSDGTTMWVSDYVDDKIYAYSMSERTRDETTEFDNLGAAGISDPRGVWSDGFTMWVLDRGNGKIYAFRMSDKGRDATRDFNTLQAAGNTAPTGFWSDGETVWAVDRGDNKLYAYNAAPLYLGSAGAKDTALTLTFSRKLATATLANTAFTVKKTPAGSSTEETVTLSATAPAISGKTVTLTLATAVAAGDTGIKVTYTKPATGSSNKITDSNGNEFASFADQAVTNNTLPVVASAAANGTALVITFDDDLASAAMLANDAFTVKKTPAGSTTEETVILSATAPAISGKTVTLTLATALAAGDTGVKVSYAQPSSGANNKLADADGNLVASFTDQTVTNNTPQGTDATLSALTVSPRNIIGFRSDLKSYHVGVASTVTTPTVTAVTTHPHATVAFTPATDADTNADGHQVTLSAGGNMVTVTVTAEDTTTTETYTLTINRGAATTYGWKASEDLDGLIGAKSEKPWSVWSDGTNMWVADWTDDKIYAYNWPDGGRDSTKDFNTLTAAGNAQPGDIWSDGTTMWVVDQTDHKVYSYNHPFLFLSATGNGTSLVLTFNRDLAAASGLVNSAFTIKKTPGMGMEETVALTGSPAISGRTVTLTLAMALVDTDTNIKVSYAKPSTGSNNKVSYAKPSTGSNNKIADADGNEAASFTDRPGIKTSTDATLSALTVSPRDIDGFTSDRETYEVGVASTVATATVTATVNDSTATVAFTTATDADTNTDGHQVNLSAGRNTVTVEVTAEDTMTTRTYTVSINRGGAADYGWKASADFDSLIAAGNIDPTGIWTDGTTMWAADSADGKIYAYQVSGRSRDSGKDFSLDTNNADPAGIWSDGTTMWVADSVDNKAYAYKMSDRSRDSGKDFDLAADNADPAGIWSDDTTIWVLDSVDNRLYAYQVSDQMADGDKDFSLHTNNADPAGIWSDGITMWVADSADDKIYAYRMSDEQRAMDQDFDTLSAAGNIDPRGIWSHGTTTWVADTVDNKVYSYNYPFYIASAKVDGTELVISFNRDLASAASLANSAFTVEKKPRGGRDETVNLAGSPAISGKTLTLTLASAVIGSDTNVKVSYTKPAAGSNNRLADGNGNEFASVTPQPVTNNAPMRLVCDRTPGVRDGIIAAVSGITDCADITTTHLEGIQTLDLASDLADTTTTLRSDDFDGLTKLTTLDLSDNSLASLPDNIFQSLRSITSLDLSGNAGSATFKPRVFTGDSTSISGSAGRRLYTHPRLRGSPWVDNVEYAWSQVTARGSHTLATDPLPMTGATTPRMSYVVPSVEHDTTVYFRLTVTGKGAGSAASASNWRSVRFLLASAQPSTCNRTPEVRDKIVSLVSGARRCNQVTSRHLAAITYIGLADQLDDSTTSLKNGDFNGFTGLTSLDLGQNNLSSLPAGIFRGTTKLKTLDLADNNLSSLPDNIFEPLTKLTSLNLRDNPGLATFKPTVDAGDSGGTSGVGDTVRFTPRVDGGPWGENIKAFAWIQVTADGSFTNATTNLATITGATSQWASYIAPTVTSATELHFLLSVQVRGGKGGNLTTIRDWVTMNIVPVSTE